MMDPRELSMPLAGVSQLILLFDDPHNCVLDFTKKVKVLDLPDNFTNLQLLKPIVREAYKEATGQDELIVPKTLKEMTPVIMGEDAVATYLLLQGGMRHNKATTDTQVYKNAVALHHALLHDKSQLKSKCEFHKLHKIYPQELNHECTDHCETCIDTLVDFLYLNTLCAFILLQEDDEEAMECAFHPNAYLKLRFMMIIYGISYSDLVEYPWVLLTACVQRNIVPHLFTKNMLADKICSVDLVFSKEEEESQKGHHIQLFAPGIEEHAMVESETDEKSSPECKDCKKHIRNVERTLDYYTGMNNCSFLKTVFGFKTFLQSNKMPRVRESEGNKLSYGGVLNLSRAILEKELMDLKSCKYLGRLYDANPGQLYVYSPPSSKIMSVAISKTEQLLLNLLDEHMRYSVDKKTMESIVENLGHLSTVLRIDPDGDLSPEEATAYAKYKQAQTDEYQLFCHPIEQIAADLRFPLRKEKNHGVPIPYMTVIHKGKHQKVYKTRKQVTSEMLPYSGPGMYVDWRSMSCWATL